MDEDAAVRGEGIPNEGACSGEVNEQVRALVVLYGDAEVV